MIKKKILIISKNKTIIFNTTELWFAANNMYKMRTQGLIALIPSLLSHMDIYSYTVHAGDECWQLPLNIITILVNNSLRNLSLWVIPPTHYWAISLYVFSFCFTQPTNLVNQLPHGTKVSFNPAFCRFVLQDIFGNIWSWASYAAGDLSFLLVLLAEASPGKL